MGLTQNDLKRGEFVTVADSDGQQYVVLEVIQLEDGTEKQVTVLAGGGIMEDEEDQGKALYDACYAISVRIW